MRERLNRPVDATSLVAFRVLFGAVMAVAMLRLLLTGWIEPLIVAPGFHFTYQGFGWVRPWPGAGMFVHVGLLAAAAMLVATGRVYRLATIVFFAGFTYLELIDKALYLNHYYLVSLLAGMLALLPAPRLGRTVPAWVLWAFRLQVALVYVFAGVAKLNTDWLVDAQPLRMWLAARADLPLIGPWLEVPTVARVMSWGGALFDLTIVPLLLTRRTRTVAFACLVGFHAVTGALFPIGMFPLIMTAAATLLLPPDWPRRWVGRPADEAPIANAFSPPLMGLRQAIVGLHLLVQVLLPLRQHLAREPSAWTGRGFNFAWNVMVAEKSGTVAFRLVDGDSGEETLVRATDQLSRQQEAAMAQDPEMIAAFARQLAAAAAKRGESVRIFADARASLNGRPPSPLLDPTRDLAVEPPRVLALPR